MLLYSIIWLHMQFKYVDADRQQQRVRGRQRGALAEMLHKNSTVTHVSLPALLARVEMRRLAA